MKYVPTPEELASGDWVWDDALGDFRNKYDIPEEPEPAPTHKVLSNNALYYQKKL